MAITLAQILDAITSTLSAATTLSRAQSYDEMTDGMNDLPTLQVYPETNEQDISGNADYYAQQRRHLGEDMAALVNGMDDMANVIEQQDTKPYFGLDGIKAFHWSWRRVTFVYGDPQLSYVGARFTITVRVF